MEQYSFEFKKQLAIKSLIFLLRLVPGDFPNADQHVLDLVQFCVGLQGHLVVCGVGGGDLLYVSSCTRLPDSMARHHHQSLPCSDWLIIQPLSLFTIATSQMGSSPDHCMRKHRVLANSSPPQMKGMALLVFLNNILNIMKKTGWIIYFTLFSLNILNISPVLLTVAKITIQKLLSRHLNICRGTLKH